MIAFYGMILCSPWDGKGTEKGTAFDSYCVLRASTAAHHADDAQKLDNDDEGLRIPYTETILTSVSCSRGHNIKAVKVFSTKPSGL